MEKRERRSSSSSGSRPIGSVGYENETMMTLTAKAAYSSGISNNSSSSVTSNNCNNSASSIKLQ
jgi:hypothetical protein